MQRMKRNTSGWKQSKSTERSRVMRDDYMAGVGLYHRRVSVRQCPVQLSAAKSTERNWHYSGKPGWKSGNSECIYLCGYTNRYPGTLHGTSERLSPGAPGIATGGSGTMEFCTDSGGSGFWTCLSVLSATERWKGHCSILRGSAWIGTVLASGTVTGSFVSDLFPGDRDRATLLPFNLHICVVFG